MTELEVSRRGDAAAWRPQVDPAALLAAAWLAGYAGRTREAYAADLKQWGAFCDENGVEVLAAVRAHVQLYAAGLTEAGRAPGTVSRKLSAIAGFYSYCVVEGAIAKSPAEHVRRPKVSTESTRLGLDRDELRSLLSAAAATTPQVLALVSLLALNGLRVSEACGARASDLGDIRGRPVLAVLRKGGKRATVPLAPRTAAAIAALGRTGEQLLIGCDRYAAWRLVHRCVDAAGITKTISPHSLRHSFVTLSLEAGVPLHDVQDAAGHADPRTTQRYNRARHQLENHATYAVADFLEQPGPVVVITPRTGHDDPMTATASPAKTTVPMSEVRTWATGRGMGVNPSGNLPRDVVDAFNKAHRTKQFVRAARSTAR